MAPLDDGPSKAGLVLALQVVQGILLIAFCCVGLVQRVDMIAVNIQTRILLLTSYETVVVTVC